MNPKPKTLSRAARAAGGSQRSRKKTAAARANGTHGGRPRSAQPSPAALRKRAQRAKHRAQKSTSTSQPLIRA